MAEIKALEKAPSDWISAYAKVEAALATRISEEFPDEIRTLMSASADENWSAEKDIYIFGGISAEDAIQISKAESLAWVSFRVFLAKAVFGDVGAMRTLYAELHESYKEDALQSVHRMMINSTYEDHRRRFDMKVIDQIAEWGLPLPPDALVDNPALLHFLTPEDSGRIAEGFATQRILEIMESAANAGDYDTFDVFRRVMKKRDGAVKMDDHHLVTVDYEPSIEGLGKLKRIFDFYAGRVMEIYQPPGAKQQAMASVSFEEYNRNVLEEARETLILLKGAPDSVMPFIKKRPLGAGGP